MLISREAQQRVVSDKSGRERNLIAEKRRRELTSDQAGGESIFRIKHYNVLHQVLRRKEPGRHESGAQPRWT